MWRDAAISSFHCPTKIIFGVGAHTQIADVVRARGISRVLVVLDPALADSALYKNVTDVLARSDIATAAVIVDASGASDSTAQSVLGRRQPTVQPEFDASARAVQAALASSRAHRAEMLLAIGGSGAIHLATAVRRTMSGQTSGPTLPIMAIPTTDGATAAVSYGCDVAILDPLTVSSMRAHDAAYAGIDAFVQAFESYLSKRATVFSDAVNPHAMTLIAGSIRAFVADRNNESAALDVLCGSSLAAMSSRETGLGNVTCMATSVSASFPVPLGLASAVCLPHAAAFNVSANPERYARIAAILGIDGTGRSEAKGGAQAIHGLRALCADLGIPPRLRDVGVTEDRLDELARLSFANDHSACNPRDTSEQDFRALFRAAF